MSVLRAISLSYMPKEDRILAAINPDGPEAWSCWLTRRLVRTLLDRSTELLVNTSALVQRVPADAWSEVISFEREAALASTAKAMSQTPTDVLEKSASMAELIEQITISSQSDGFRVVFKGAEGGATGLLKRVQLQRLIQMVQGEVAKANWFDTQAGLPAASAPAGSKPVHH